MERKRPRVQFFCTGPSRAKQSFKEECDINNVMRRFEKTGIIEHTNRFEGGYGDYLSAPQDYHEAVNQVMAADAMFSSLPARVRARFHNDPASFLAFVESAETDEENRAELDRLGLLRPRPDPEPDPEIIQPPSPQEAAG